MSWINNHSPIEKISMDADYERRYWTLGKQIYSVISIHTKRNLTLHPLPSNASSRTPDFVEVYEWLGLIALMQQKPQYHLLDLSKFK